MQTCACDNKGVRRQSGATRPNVTCRIQTQYRELHNSSEEQMLKAKVHLFLIFPVTWQVNDQCWSRDDHRWPLHCVWMLKCVWHREQTYLWPHLHVILTMKQLSWEHEREKEMMPFANRGVRPVVLEKIYLGVGSVDEKHCFSQPLIIIKCVIIRRTTHTARWVRALWDRCLRWMIGLQRIYSRCVWECFQWWIMGLVGGWYSAYFIFSPLFSHSALQ